MSDLFPVSQSKIKTWRKCRFAYHMRYVEKLRRRRISRPLKFGRIVHSMLEAHANGDDPLEVLDKINLDEQQLFASEREEYGEIIEDIRCIMLEYQSMDFKQNTLTPLRRNGKASEHWFELPLPEYGIIVVGKIDEVARTRRDKLTWLVENKTFRNLPDEDHRWRNLQSAVYVKVMDMLGWWKVDGTMWNYIRSKPPTRPQMLKSSKMSQRGIDTLPSRVLETLKEHKQDPKNFRTLLMSAENNRSNYFMRIRNPVKKRVVEALWHDFLATAIEMRMMHGKTQVRTIEQHCTWCDYEPICRAALQGSDVEYVKEKEFYVHEKSDEPEVEAE